MRDAAARRWTQIPTAAGAVAAAVLALALTLAPGMAHAQPPTWHFETLDGSGSIVPGHTTDGVGTSTAVTDFEGQVHVFTFDATTGSLRHEWWDGARWHFETLDGTGSTWPRHTTDNVGLDNVAIIFANQLHVFNFDDTFTLDHGSLSGGSLPRRLVGRCHLALPDPGWDRQHPARSHDRQRRCLRHRGHRRQ